MTYLESAALMTDGEFRGRVKVAVLKYADSIMNESSSQTAHNSRLRWAVIAFQQPDQTAAQVQPPTVMDPAIQTDGAASTDAQIQGAVEAVINKLI